MQKRVSLGCRKDAKLCCQKLKLVCSRSCSGWPSFLSIKVCRSCASLLIGLGIAVQYSNAVCSEHACAYLHSCFQPSQGRFGYFILNEPHALLWTGEGSDLKSAPGLAASAVTVLPGQKMCCINISIYTSTDLAAVLLDMGIIMFDLSGKEKKALHYARWIVSIRSRTYAPCQERVLQIL